jgi:uncharacterized protein YdeI (YjbR/CyaY-like superfamily)
MKLSSVLVDLDWRWSGLARKRDMSEAMNTRGSVLTKAGAALAQIEVRSTKELERWLRKHHGQHESVWLVTYKKHRPEYVAYGEVVDVLLAWGWIDSLPRKLDDDRTMHLISPRKPKSAWSLVNRKRVETLEAQGRMAAPGRALVVAAKASGAWDKLKTIDGETLPNDVHYALRKAPAAQRFFEAFPPSTRRGILEWIVQAKAPATRSKRIAETVRLAAMNVRANTPSAKGK